MVGDYICTNCFRNPGLIEWITNHSEENIGEEDAQCSYCDGDRGSRIIADFDEFCNYINDRVSALYSDASELSYDNEEEKYIGDTIDSDEVLDEMGLDIVNGNSCLYSDLINNLNLPIYCKNNYFQDTEFNSLSYSWDEFKNTAQTGTIVQFFYGIDPDNWEIESPVEFLDTLSAGISQLGLIKEISSGTKMFRARVQEPGQQLQLAEEFGPPPRELATKPNRFNPPGTVMLYVAENASTAQSEVDHATGTCAIGQFELTSSLFVFDAVDLPNEICLFSEDEEMMREKIAFMRMFANEIAEPITKDDFYLPTQIVTRHLQMKANWLGSPIHGIRYRSSKAKDGVNYALFGNRIKIFSKDSDVPLNNNLWLDSLHVNFGNLVFRSVAYYSK